jgi:UDP-N-acetylmuramoylalanine--D-glutamate ligase
MVLNQDDALVMAMAEAGRRMVRFALHAPQGAADYGIASHDGVEWIVRGEERVMRASELRIAGRHNLANALAALALGEAAGLPREAMLTTLREFPGLPHRCQFVAERDGVGYYNDSKGTNVGSTLAALNGMPGAKVVLIAGGEGKGQDFTPLRGALAAHARAVVLIGRDADLIADAIGDAAPVLRAGSMAAAVQQARGAARPGDTVLLSPACASFDMFKNYVHRGEVFAAAVKELAP